MMALPSICSCSNQLSIVDLVSLLLPASHLLPTLLVRNARYGCPLCSLMCGRARRPLTPHAVCMLGLLTALLVFNARRLLSSANPLPASSHASLHPSCLAVLNIWCLTSRPT